MADLPLRLLIVEDSDEDAQLLLRELRRGGYEPQHTVVQSADALDQALDQGPWDLVVADYSMPGFSGTAALQRLRDRGLDVPFIFVSGTIGEDVAVAAMRSGAQDYLRVQPGRQQLRAKARGLHGVHGRRAAARALLAAAQRAPTAGATGLIV